MSILLLLIVWLYFLNVHFDLAVNQWNKENESKLGLYEYDADIDLSPSSLIYPLYRSSKKYNDTIAPLFGDIRRSVFSSVANARRNKMPILMDGFTYCENDHLHLDAIFNLKYTGVSKRKRQNLTSCLITATIEGETVANTMTRDLENHSMVLSFEFMRTCKNFDNLNVSIYHTYLNKTYDFTAPALHDFTKNRYYLTVSTSISRVDINRLKMWIYYYLYQGAEYFVVFANGFYGAWKKRLASFINSGVLTVVDLSFPNHLPFYEQQVALQICNRRLRYASKFVIYNDIDEFFFPRDPSKRVVDVVRDYDLMYSNMSAFKLENAYIACRKDPRWYLSYNPVEHCNVLGYHQKGRSKVIAKPLKSSYIQVHRLSNEPTMFFDPDKDMVMAHYKRQRGKVMITLNVSAEFNETMRKVYDYEMHKFKVFLVFVFKDVFAISKLKLN